MPRLAIVTTRSATLLYTRKNGKARHSPQKLSKHKAPGHQAVIAARRRGWAAGGPWLGESCVGKGSSDAALSSARQSAPE